MQENYDKWLMSDADFDRFWGEDSRDDDEAEPGIYFGEWEDGDVAAAMAVDAQRDREADRRTE